MTKKLTPQEQAENMLAGLKHTYRVVAVRHVHPWYSWALLASAIGFIIGVSYVVNERGTFDASLAARVPARSETINSADSVVKLIDEYSKGETVRTVTIQRILPTIRKGPDNDLLSLGKKDAFEYSGGQNAKLKTFLNTLNVNGAVYELLLNDGSKASRGFIVFTNPVQLKSSDYFATDLAASPALAAQEKADKCYCDVKGTMPVIRTQTVGTETTTKEENVPILLQAKRFSCTNDAVCSSSCLSAAELEKINSLNKGYSYLDDESKAPVVLYAVYGDSKVTNNSRCNNSTIGLP